MTVCARIGTRGDAFVGLMMLIGFVAAALSLAVSSAIGPLQEYRDAFKHCIADGRKDYQCVPVLRGVAP